MVAGALKIWNRSYTSCRVRVYHTAAFHSRCRLRPSALAPVAAEASCRRALAAAATNQRLPEPLVAAAMPPNQLTAHCRRTSPGHWMLHSIRAAFQRPSKPHPSSPKNHHGTDPARQWRLLLKGRRLIISKTGHAG
jgi:hypothetical protein